MPSINRKDLKNSGQASIELRLGRWFITMKQTSETHLDVIPGDSKRPAEKKIAKNHFVPFGKEFVIHPGRFVLASTLEWVSLPLDISGYVGGKSTWGRRGIIIETAAGVHPGFSGCLTLEIANVGEVPVRLRPGMLICQLFMHAVDGDVHPSETPLAGRRRPALGSPKADRILEKLSALHDKQRAPDKTSGLRRYVTWRQKRNKNFLKKSQTFVLFKPHI